MMAEVDDSELTPQAHAVRRATEQQEEQRLALSRRKYEARGRERESRDALPESRAAHALAEESRRLAERRRQDGARQREWERRRPAEEYRERVNGRRAEQLMREADLERTTSAVTWETDPKWLAGALAELAAVRLVLASFPSDEELLRSGGSMKSFDAAEEELRSMGEQV